MESEIEINQLCRLCLVKEQVNVPIFEGEDDLGQIFLKISACLPVKISRDDSLPKKICASCSCKLDVVYEFWNTSATSEKHLLKLLNQLNVNTTTSSMANNKNSDSQIAHSINSDIINLKQEVVELAEDEDNLTEDMDDSNDATESYMLQQQHIPYQNFSFQDGFSQDETSRTASSTVTSKTAVTRAKRKRRVTSKALQSQIDSDDEDSLLRGKITKTEEQSDSGDDPEPTTFVGLPSTTTDDQPGPSGINKANSDAPSSERLRSKILNRTKLKKFRHLTKSKVFAISSLSCKICDKTFSSAATLYQHRIVHKEKVFGCKQCEKKFKSKYEVKIHYQTYHSFERSFSCQICDRKFNKKQTLKYHQARHAQDYKIKCSECEKGFYTMQDFKKHYAVRHKGVRFVCGRCQKSFIDQNCYKRHLKTHETNYTISEYKCQLCEKVYKSRGGLNVHIKSHQNLTYVCDICGKTVTSKRSLNHHIMTHTGEKPFVCDMCGKCFNKKPLLKVHERIHTKERPYKCTQCNKTFSQRSTLTVHMRYHTGDRPHKCNICQKSFVTKTLLKIHSKSHGTPLANV